MGSFFYLLRLRIFFKFSTDILFDHGLNSVFWAEPYYLENLSILENLTMKYPYTDRPIFRQSAPHRYQCLISHFLASLGAGNLILYIHVLINWQLSKQCIHWPVSPDRISASGIDLLSSKVFFSSYQLTQLQLFKWSQAQVQFFKNAYDISLVHEPHFENFDFKLTSDAKIEPAFTCFWLFLP